MVPSGKDSVKIELNLQSSAQERVIKSNDRISAFFCKDNFFLFLNIINAYIEKISMSS